MPRYVREKCEKQVYHIMLKGDNREKIFIDDAGFPGCNLKDIGLLKVQLAILLCNYRYRSPLSNRLAYWPYPSFSRSSFGIKRRAAELMQ